MGLFWKSIIKISEVALENVRNFGKIKFKDMLEIFLTA